MWGCGSPQQFATARTVTPGDIEAGFAAEMQTRDGTLTPAPAPVALLRVGVAGRVDVGARLGLSQAGVDARAAVVESPSADVTLTAGVGYLSVAHVGFDDEVSSRRHPSTAWFAPVAVTLGGANSASFTPLVTIGATGAQATEDLENEPVAADGKFRTKQTTRVAPRVTVGARVRVSRGFAVQPEITFTENPFGDTAVYLGLGFIGAR